MKLDLNLIREILVHVEAETILDFLDDEKNFSKWKEGQLLSELYGRGRIDAGKRVVLTHVKLLIDNGYIDGLHIKQGCDGNFSVGIAPYPSLTLLGYSVLETVRTKGFYERLKAIAKEKSVPLTLETIRLIASATIQKILF